jgi:hypothetical protein
MLAAFLGKLPAETAALGEAVCFSILIGNTPRISVASGSDGVLEFRRPSATSRTRPRWAGGTAGRG